MISAPAEEHLGGLQRWTVVDQGALWFCCQEVGCYVGTDQSALVSRDFNPGSVQGLTVMSYISRSPSHQTE